jgi:hypothetical protein
MIHLDAEGYIDRTPHWQLLDDEMGNPEGNQSEFFAIIKLKPNKINSEQNPNPRYAGLFKDGKFQK